MSREAAQQVQIHTELSRDLNLTSALAIGVGTMIAAGIFTLSGLAVKYVQSSAIIAFLLAALVATFTALTYCEFSSIYPESGEGYLYARKTFSPPVAYFVGWALFLGYTSSCGFYIASLSTYFNEFVYHMPTETMAGLIGLGLLVLLNLKGTKESGQFQVVITGAKVVLLMFFIGGGLMQMDTVSVMDKFSTDIAKIFQTSALVFITFFGFSAIAASAGEVQNPTKTIPRAIFISMFVVSVLYVLVILTMVGANLTEYTEAAMGKAAEMFLGSIGGKVIVAGALSSMISAANASIMAGSRVVLSMSQLGHLPEFIGKVDPKTKTPAGAIWFVGLGIAFFAVALELEECAHFANAVLLLALITVNFALIKHRKLYPELERPFKVPLVPLIPLLGILSNLGLLVQAMSHPKPAVLTLASLSVGLVGFFLWKGTMSEEATLPGEPSRVALVESSSAVEGGFRVLVPLAHPDNVQTLVELAAGLQEQVEIVALRVVSLPEQLPQNAGREYIERERPILERAFQYATEGGATCTNVVRIGKDISRAVLDTAREHRCDLIVLGWKGYSTKAEKILGETTDSIVALARADLMLVKLEQRAPAGRFLLPTAGGEHARAAELYAARMVAEQEGASLTLCTVVKPSDKKARKEAAQVTVDEAVARVKEQFPDMEVETRVLLHEDVTVGILSAAKAYDTLVVGAAGGSLYPQIMFGNIPEALAKEFEGPVIMVKSHHPIKALLGRLMSS